MLTNDESTTHGDDQVDTESRAWTVPALCLLVALAPFNLALRSSPPVLLLPLVAGALIVGVLVAVVTLWDLGGPQRLPRHLKVMGWLTILLLGLIWLSALTSGHIRSASGGGARVSVMPVVGLAIALVAARSPQRTEAVATRLMGWMAGGALAGIAVGLVVQVAGRDVLFTDHFFGQVTMLGPHDRLTRPWAHANVAAMAITASAVGVAALRPRLRWPAVSGLLVAVVLTYSRGAAIALVAAGVAWIVLARSGRAGALKGIAALGVVAAVIGVASPGFSTRASDNETLAWWGVEIAVAPSIEFEPSGASVSTVVELANTSDLTWPSEGDDRVQLSARFVEPGTTRVWGEQLWDLAADTPSGGRLQMQVDLEPSAPPGTHDLHWDLLVRDEAYFREFSGSESVLSTVVIPVGASTTTAEDPSDALVGNRSRASRPTLWRAALSAFADQPVLGVGPTLLARSDETVTASHAHHIVLEPLATWGLPATAALIALLGGALVLAIRTSRRDGDLASRAIAVGLVAVATHGLVDWPLVHVGSAIPIAVLCGLAWARHETGTHA